MKKNSYFINTSRGELVDEKALLYSLRKKDLGGAALDVLTNENQINSKSNHPLINYSKKIQTLLLLLILEEQLLKVLKKQGLV